MELAIAEGQKGAGFVAPNPLVGCVILDEKMRLLSTGYHKMYGAPHAEVEALKGVSDEQIEGAHVFVTLEPCAHEGKTPSCAKHLAKLPIASVTYGVKDPNPAVNGEGVKILQAAGIQVTQFEGLQSELEELAEIFLFNHRKHAPFVSLKVATSLDGQMGLKHGQSQWITNEASRHHVHFLRACHDAILVGRNTIEIDNPRLNIRHPHFPGRTNQVVILDSEGVLFETLAAKRVSSVHQPKDIWLVTKRGVKPPQGSPFGHVECDRVDGQMFDLRQLLKELFQRGIRSLMVEGGSMTYKSFFLQKQLQRLIHFQAPILLGHENGLPWTQGLDIRSMEDRIRLKDVKARFFDGDLMTTARLSEGF
jgi:diaminohydroxyphosphoribosylaminopyrimidine deaminase/5-amino-6-(5-phosphoribosylamino)uracil reductase